MKQIIPLIVFLICFSCINKNEDITNNCNQNYIIAGDSINDCSEIVDINPDILINPYSKKKSTDGSGFGNFDLDLDRDANIDVIFNTNFNVSAGGWDGEYGSNLKIQNQQFSCAIVFNSNIIRLFNILDTIDNNAVWTSNTEIIIASTKFGVCPPVCPGYKNSVNDNMEKKYIGLRKIVNSDTTYYYINLDIVTSNNLIIKSLGGNKK